MEKTKPRPARSNLKTAPDQMVARPAMQVLSILIPVHNESGNIPALLARMKKALAAIDMESEIVFVDDGSRDHSWKVIKEIAASEPMIRGVSFSRNFGKEIAIAAGLDMVRGDAVVMIDGDLQQPPELIPDMVSAWRRGAMTVYGERIDRHSDGPVRRVVTNQFYKIFSAITDTKLAERAGDFRLMDRKVVDALRRLPEKARFNKGLYAWVGFSSEAIPYDHVDRHAGDSQWGFVKLFRFALDGITAFSTTPLRLATYVGISVSALALLYAVYLFVRTALYGPDVPGYPSLIVSILFFAGVQLISLGVIGEYIGRIYNEVKNRPLYVIAETIGAEEAASASEKKG
jgi:polyisoprenyl-phosphate glycosyltransferase